MYNRYIPQPDGSYRRNRLPDAVHQPPPPPPPQRQPEYCPPEPEAAPAKKAECPKKSNKDGFLQQLLPRDFDTGDLIVILLLLLMAGDSEEDRNNAILTMALYFLM